MFSLRNQSRLSVRALEARCVPATFSFLAGTLTVTAAEGNAITVQQSLDAPAGYLKASDGNKSFDSLTKSQPVTHVVVNMSLANVASLTLLQSTLIPGNLTVLGAKQDSGAYNRAYIGQNFTYLAAAGVASDVIELTSDGSVAGNAMFKLGGGVNEVNLTGGVIGANLSVIGGADFDTVHLTSANEVVVKGSATFNLGNGTNTIDSAGNEHFTVAKDFTYIGGAGKNIIDLNTAFDTVLGVGGKLKVGLGGAVGTFNRFETVEMSLGSSASITGGNDPDIVQMGGPTNLGGSLSISTGDGNSLVSLDEMYMGGSLTCTGGLDQDTFDLNEFVVGKNLTVNLKGDRTAAAQLIGIGNEDTQQNFVFGSVALTTGIGKDTVDFHRTVVGGNLTIATGAGEDLVTIDDASIARVTSIDLGIGNDTLEVDNANADGGGALNGDTTFGGTFTVKAGAGNDTVRLSSTGGTLIKFGSKVSLFGADGTDKFENTVLNVFLGPASQEDFETDNGVALP